MHRTEKELKEDIAASNKIIDIYKNNLTSVKHITDINLEESAKIISAHTRGIKRMERIISKCNAILKSR